MPNTVIEAQEATESAEQAVVTAHEKVTTLEQKVINGDGKVTAAQITTAKEQAAFAELQASAAQNEEARVREAVYQAELAEFMAEYEEFASTDMEPLREAYNLAVVGLAEFISLVKERKEYERSIRLKARPLNLGGPDRTNEPVWKDRERWHSIVMPSEVATIVDYVRHEAENGYPVSAGRVTTHMFHTDARRADMATIRSAPRGAYREAARPLLDALVKAYTEE